MILYDYNCNTNYALYEGERIRKVTIPETATEIGQWAFWNCETIMEVTLSGSIGANTFRDCNNLIIVNIRDGATTIGDAAFQNLTALEEVYIPDSVTSIADNAFDGHSAWLTIYGNEGSHAQEYAAARGITFCSASVIVIGQ